MKNHFINHKTKKMYKRNKIPVTTLRVNQSYEGETIEQKIHRIVNNKEPIKDGAPIIFTERKDGVRPEYDIRTDRWEIAADAMDSVTKSHLAKRAERHKETPQNDPNYKGPTTEENGGAESIQGTDPKK